MYLEEEAPKLSEHRQTGPDEKIRRTAFELFYRQGYHATGINQIIEESGTSKKSFYRYFPAKENLARAYLGERKEFYLEFFRKLGKRCPELHDFMNTWMFVLKKEVECDRYHGCAFANFSGQTMEAPAVFLTDLRDVAARRRPESSSTPTCATWSTPGAKSCGTICELAP